MGILGAQSCVWRATPSQTSVRPKVTLQPAEVRTILNLLEEPHRTMLLLIAVTGMRISELLGLQWPDIDFGRRLIHIRRTFYRGCFGLPKTQASERVIPMTDGLFLALQQHQRIVKRSAIALVFPNADGKPYEAANLLRRLLHPALAKSGLPKTGWRVFRRSVATALSEKSGTSENCTASSRTLVPAYDSVLHPVGGRIPAKCDFET